MLKIGHRGACGHAPENTLASIQKAIELGVDMVEFDVQICKNAEAVVIHDSKVNRTTNGKGYVKNLTLKELKMLNIEQAEKIPTLIEALELINRKVKVNIELKGKGCALVVGKVIEEFIQNRNWKADDFIVSSFDWEKLAIFHSDFPEIKVSILVKSKLKGIFKYSSKNILREAKKINAYSINFPLRTISNKKIDFMHKNGFKVFAYTVNNFSDIQRMKQIGVDGIFSNYPERI